MKKAKIILLDNLDIILFFVLVTIKTFFMEAKIANTYIYYTYFMKPTIASLLVLGSFAFLFKKQGRTKYLYTCNLVITIFMVSDMIYYRYFKDVLSIMVIRNAFLLDSVSSSIKDVIKITDFIFFADCVLLPFIHRYKNKVCNVYKFKVRLGIFTVALILGLGIEIQSFAALSHEQPRLLSTMFNKTYIEKMLGFANYHAVDVYNTAANLINSSLPLSKAKENEIMTFMSNNSKSISTGKNLTNSAKGKNLIVIQVEALQQFVIGKSVNGQEITPNLNRWLGKSTYFDNCFYQVAAGGTSDAEFLVNNSLYPAPEGAVYYLYPNDTFDSLGKQLQKSGYGTFAFHGYNQTFWNRNIMYKSEGFDKFYNENDYKIDEVIGMGLSDKSFLNQSITKLQSLKSPFFSFLITLSSHHPFNDTAHYGDFNVGEFENTFMGNYLKAIHYTDEQLGMFLDSLQQNGMMDNSIIILYGDHFAMPKEHQADLEKFLGNGALNDEQWLSCQKVPLMIHFPGDANKGVNEEYCGQVDVYPTIANLFGLSHNTLLGHDLFNTANNTVIFRNGSFINKDYCYVSQSDAFYNTSTSTVVQATSDLNNEKQNVIKILDYSDEILKHNLLKKIDTSTEDK